MKISEIKAGMSFRIVGSQHFNKSAIRYACEDAKADGSKYSRVHAWALNGAMPSGWECADISFIDPDAEVELVDVPRYWKELGLSWSDVQARVA